MAKYLRVLVTRAVPAVVAVMIAVGPVVPAFGQEADIITAPSVVSDSIAPVEVSDVAPVAPVPEADVVAPAPIVPDADKIDSTPDADVAPASASDTASQGAGSPPPPPGAPDFSGPLDPPYIATQPVAKSYQIRPDVDQSTGALTYRYPITLPPGRNGMTPDVSLIYNSQDKRESSQVGYGWSLSIPSIDRQNLAGLATYFNDEFFTSSLSGELVRIATGEVSNNFSARIDDGSFTRYTFSGNAWIAETKDGSRYYFGTATSSRIHDESLDPNAANTAKWLIDKIEDKNGNQINFSYFHDSNQAYLDTITYTDTSTNTGPFLVKLNRELRPDLDRSINISYATGFRVETKYRISEIQSKINGALANRYALSYTASATNNRSLLTSITQTGYDAFGVPTVLPATQFSYRVGSMNFELANPNPFASALATSSLSHGFLIVDVNGDSYADLIRSWEKEGQGFDQRIWINDREGALVETNWVRIKDMDPICHEDPTLKCASRGVVITDKTGDLLADFYQALGGSTILRPNVGDGWGVGSSGSGYSLVSTYTYRPVVAPFDGANPDYVQEIQLTSEFGTDGAFGNRVADANHDGLPDAIRSTGDPQNTNGLSEGIFLNRGINPGGSVNFEREIGWLFLNGTNVGANASAANAVFEQLSFKEAFLADLNGDDLPEVVTEGKKIYRHNGNTWVLDSTPITFTDPHETTQVADMNGDGSLDLIVSDPCGSPSGYCGTKVYYNTSVTPDVLETITLPIGGTIGIAYKPSSLYEDGNGDLLNPKLPMIIQTVESITETDPVKNIVGVTRYSYAGGRYYFKTATDRRFAGFAEVTAVKPDGSKSISYFNVFTEGKLGKLEKTELYDSANTLLKRTLTEWNATPLSAIASDRKLVIPEISAIVDFEAGNNRARASQSVYDTATGALLQVIDYGEVDIDEATTTPEFTDIGTDKRVTTYTYATNANGIELPATQTVTDFNGATVAESRSYYDGLSLGQVTTGNRTKDEQLIDATAGTYSATERTYNSNGLVLTETDPLSHITQFSYDALGLYPATVTNALNQQTSFTYDYTSGSPITVTDPNGEVRTTTLDGLDRVIKEWTPKPEDGTAMLTRIVSYDDVSGGAAIHDQKIFQGTTMQNNHSIDLESTNSEYLSAPDSASLSITGDMTLELWAKLESTPASGQSYTFISKFLPTNSNISYLFDYENNGGTPRLRFIASASGVSGVAGSVNYTLSTGTWYHIASVYTASQGSVEFFVNGASIGSASGLPVSIKDSTANLSIGMRDDGQSTTAFFDGLIDDVRVWDVARAAAQINDNKAIRIDSATGLKGSWHLDNALTDASGNNNTLSNPLNASFVADVPFGGGTGNAVAPDTHAYLDGLGRVIQERSRIANVGNEERYAVVNTFYDNSGRVSAVALPYSGVGSARETSAPNPALTTEYFYDALGRVTETNDAIGNTFASYNLWETTVTDPNGNIKKFGRDAFNRLVEVKEYLTPTSNPFITSYEWNTNGNLTKITDSLGNIRNFTYDARGLRKTAEDLHVIGDTTFGKYTFAYDNAGNLVRKRTPKSERIDYGYDALNRPTTENFAGAAGVEVTYVYDSCANGIGRLCSESKDGFSKALVYDEAGNIASETSTIGGTQFATSYSRDYLGGVKSITHPNGSITSYLADEGNRTKEVWFKESANGTPTVISSAMEYAPHGALTKAEYGNGIEENFTFDPMGKYRLSEHVTGPVGSVGVPGSPNTHSIDLEDSAVQYLSTPDSPALSIMGDFTLEAWIKFESLPGAGNGMTIAGKWEDGFDNGSRSYVLRYSTPGGGGTGVLNLALSSDGNAWNLAMKPYAFSTGTWYHVASVYTASQGSVEFFVNGTSIGSASGLPNAIHDNGSAFAIGAHDSGAGGNDLFDGQIDDVRLWNVVRTATEINNNKSKQLDGTEGGLRAYWKLNNSYTDMFQNGNTLTPHGAPAFTTDVPFAGSQGTPPTAEPLLRQTYAYDPVGNILGVIEETENETVTSTYSYDGLDRLSTETVVTQTAGGSTQKNNSYAYDSIGNITLATKDGVQTAYTYTGNTGNSYANPHAATQIGNIAFVYDENGNVISRSDDITHTWDYNGHLTKVQKPLPGQSSEAETFDYGISTFAYDPSGMRTEVRPYSQGTTTYATQDYSASNGTSTVSFDAGGKSLGSMEKVGANAPEFFASHSDHLGSSKLATDSAGEIVESTAYDAFGEITDHEQTTTFSENRKFTGHEFDSSTDYTYAKARYLDTNFGRFISQDPAFVREPERFLTDPQQQNSYSYVRNNPIKYIDPTGESAMGFLGAAIEFFFNPKTAYSPESESNLAQLQTQAPKTEATYAVIGAIGGLITPDPSDGPKILKAADKVGDALKPVVNGAEETSKLWTPGKVGDPIKNVLQHWNDHKAEFPEFQNAKQYAEGAKDFLKNLPNGTLENTRQNGDKLFYNVFSNTFSAYTKEGIAKTFFKPKEGIEYWFKQVP